MMYKLSDNTEYLKAKRKINIRYYCGILIITVISLIIFGIIIIISY